MWSYTPRKINLEGENDHLSVLTLPFQQCKNVIQNLLVNFFYSKFSFT